MLNHRLHIILTRLSAKLSLDFLSVVLLKVVSPLLGFASFSPFLLSCIEACCERLVLFTHFCTACISYSIILCLDQFLHIPHSLLQSFDLRIEREITQQVCRCLWIASDAHMSKCTEHTVLRRMVEKHILHMTLHSLIEVSLTECFGVCLMSHNLVLHCGCGRFCPIISQRLCSDTTSHDHLSLTVLPTACLMQYIVIGCSKPVASPSHLI
jgi:hypothetical protein